MSPYFRWDWDYLILIEKVLDEFTAGTSEHDFLILNLPPRHGKSECVTIRYPVYVLERDPAARVIVGAYSQNLANRFSRMSRRVAVKRFALSGERKAVEDWETPQGGGARYVGVGSGVTGRGANLIIIDDPIKSRKEADSETYREWIWDWFTQDMYTRLEPGGKVIIIQTRWHEDDLCARILNSDFADRCKVINLPALAEEDDPLGRSPGEALCPERFPIESLTLIKQVLRDYAFGALYQQNPVPATGGVAKRHWFSIQEALPAAEMQRVRAWDLAATAKNAVSSDPDYAVGTLMGVVRDTERVSIHHQRLMDEGLIDAASIPAKYIIEDVVRVQENPDAVERLIVQTAKMDGPGVPIVIEQEGGSEAKISLHHIIGLLQGYSVTAINARATGDKLQRASPFFSQAAAGNVVLLKGSWNAAWLDEMAAFPGAHDDQVDSAAHGFLFLVRFAGTRRKAQSRQGGRR